MSDQNIQWVVSGVTADGVRYRGVQKAWYGHPAMDFFQKRTGIKFVACSAEKMSNFEHFLSKGLRNPLTAEELAL
jgi:hypothetical protein